ncbi:MAG: hypothetical protein ABIR87_05595 [Sphingomicrobium sp.]
MMGRYRLWLLSAALTAPALAADPPPAPIADVHRLSAAEVQQILDSAEARRAAPDAPPARRIEGELGVAIGTGGYREVFGTAVVPLGQDGTAILTFDTLDSNRGRVRRHR